MFSKEAWDRGSATAEDFFQIETIFDEDSNPPPRLLFNSSIHHALLRLLPPDFFFTEGEEKARAEEFLSHLPILKWWEWGDASQNFSIFLLCRYRTNAAKFFYEMISRWLIPGKRFSISSFSSTDFKLKKGINESFTICEIVLSLENPLDREHARHQLPILESEIRLGLTSVYHASRILEIKGLSADEKTSLIQERIVSLLEKRPTDFDYEIFVQMQHFLVMCTEEFKGVREYAHMSRIIYVFYLFKKELKNQIELYPGHRFIHLKLSKAYLHLPLGVKRVLGVFLGLNFLNDKECFEERHFVQVLKIHFPHLIVVEDSFFSRAFKEDLVQLIYLEIEKEGNEEFSLSEIKWLKETLPKEIRNGIEKWARPVFMPRNEEEVMRNIITLSHQLKFARDLPQVIIAFDEQTEQELIFTVIWVKIVKPLEPACQEIFEKTPSFLQFIPDRVKQVGILRKKFPKEALVFRVKFPATAFLRSDHSVDLFKARQAIVEELQRLLGEFRDYNGGMIAKQHEQFLALKELFEKLDSHEELLLENFFHSIFPIELRSLFNPKRIKKLFDLLIKEKEGEIKASLQWETDPAAAYLLLSYDQPVVKEKIIEQINTMHLSASQLLMVSLRAFETHFIGWIYLESSKEEQTIFFEKIRECL